MKGMFIFKSEWKGAMDFFLNYKKSYNKRIN